MAHPHSAHGLLQHQPLARPIALACLPVVTTGSFGTTTVWRSRQARRALLVPAHEMPAQRFDGRTYGEVPPRPPSSIRRQRHVDVAEWTRRRSTKPEVAGSTPAVDALLAVAQRIRAPPSEGGGRTFESCRRGPVESTGTPWCLGSLVSACVSVAMTACRGWTRVESPTGPHPARVTTTRYAPESGWHCGPAKPAARVRVRPGAPGFEATEMAASDCSRSHRPQGWSG